MTSLPSSKAKLARAIVAVWLFALFAGLASGASSFEDGRVAARLPTAPDSVPPR